VLLFGGVGCAADATDPEGNEAGAGDGGIRALDDASAVDGASLGGDADPDPGLYAPETDCFDFVDDDTDGVVDCADPGCGEQVVCCALGSERAGCCAPQVAASLDLSDCAAGGDIRTCAAGVSTFGTAALSLRADLAGCDAPSVLVPGDDASADTGVVLPGLLDPAVSRITVSMVVGGTATDGVARVGVALVPDAPLNGRVVPLVGVVLSAGELRVVIGEVELAIARVAEQACPTAVPVELVLDPSGAIEVRANGARIYTGAMPAAARARLAVYGRHGAGDPAAWVGGVSVRRDVCSVLAPERTTTPVLVGAAPGARIGRVSIARRDGEALGRAAIEIDGRILPATEIAGGIRVDDTENPLVVADVPRAGADWSAGASDPQLRWTGTGYQLLFAGRDADGTSNLFAMSFSAGLGSPTTPAVILSMDEASALASAQFTAIDEPAYFERAGAGYLIYRASTAEYSELRLATLSITLADALASETPPELSSRDASYAEGSLAGVLRRSGTGDGFDRDEIGAARVLDLGDGVVRIFYAGRRGTRWSIGALVTTDLVNYDQAAEGAPLLGPSGAGFDALGASSPELVVSPIVGSVAQLSMYYTASAGTLSSLGLASQAIRVGETP
jgi:hypothetical protein